MTIALVTAIYGGYDWPKPLHPVNDFDEAYLYTDSDALARTAAEMGWHAVLDEYPNGDKQLSPMLKAKYWKTHPLRAAPGAEVSVWLDGSMRVTQENMAGWCLTALGDDDLSLTPHPDRTCIYTEAAVTTSLARYADCDPVKQTTFYHDEYEHPADWGLFASGAFVARHNDRVRDWGERWWEENCVFTYQDQLSLPVLTRLHAASFGLTWNARMPWGTYWALSEHGNYS